MNIEVRLDILIPEGIDLDETVDTIVHVGAEVEPVGNLLRVHMMVRSDLPNFAIPEALRSAQARLSTALRANDEEFAARGGLLWRDIVHARASVQ